MVNPYLLWAVLVWPAVPMMMALAFAWGTP